MTASSSNSTSCASAGSSNSSVSTPDSSVGSGPSVNSTAASNSSATLDSSSLNSRSVIDANSSTHDSAATHSSSAPTKAPTHTQAAAQATSHTTRFSSTSFTPQGPPTRKVNSLLASEPIPTAHKRAAKVITDEDEESSTEEEEKDPPKHATQQVATDGNEERSAEEEEKQPSTGGDSHEDICDLDDEMFAVKLVSSSASVSTDTKLTWIRSRLFESYRKDSADWFLSLLGHLSSGLSKADFRNGFVLQCPPLSKSLLSNREGKYFDHWLKAQELLDEDQAKNLGEGKPFTIRATPDQQLSGASSSTHSHSHPGRTRDVADPALLATEHTPSYSTVTAKAQRPLTYPRVTRDGVVEAVSYDKLPDFKGDPGARTSFPPGLQFNATALTKSGEVFGPTECSAELRDQFVEESNKTNAKAFLSALKRDGTFAEFSVIHCWRKNLSVRDFITRALRDYPGARIRSSEVWRSLVRESAQLRAAFEQYERDGWVAADSPLTTSHLLDRIEKGKDASQVKGGLVSGAKQTQVAAGDVPREYLFRGDHERVQEWAARLRHRSTLMLNSSLDVFGVERKTIEELADRIALEAILLGHPHSQRGVTLVEEYLDRDKVIEDILSSSTAPPGIPQFAEVLKHKDRFLPPALTFAKLIDEDEDFGRHSLPTKSRHKPSRSNSSNSSNNSNNSSSSHNSTSATGVNSSASNQTETQAESSRIKGIGTHILGLDRGTTLTVNAKYNCKRPACGKGTAHHFVMCASYEPKDADKTWWSQQTEAARNKVIDTLVTAYKYNKTSLGPLFHGPPF